MLDSIYHMTLKLLWNRIIGKKTSQDFVISYESNIVMGVITYQY